MNEEQVARFWAKVDQGETEECWLWKASFAGKGYGQFRLPGTRRNMYAHRLAFQLATGREIPKGKHIAHKCDTPACCNPNHLFEATPAENARDMVNKGRQTWGERNTQAKLTSDQVASIRELYEQGVPQRELGKRFGVHQVTISKITRGERWNTGDIKRKPWQPRGWLSDEDASMIRRIYETGCPQWRIALAFSVTQGTISRIILGKRHRRNLK